MELKINEVFVGKRIRKEVGDLEGLAGSMKELGQLQPIVVRPDRSLIAGVRRLEAAKLLGWPKIEATISHTLKESLQLLRAERDENTCRQAFLPSEMVEAGLQLEELEREEAKKRQLRKPLDALAGISALLCSGNLPEQKGNTRDKVAKAVGVSGKTYEKAKAVVQSGDTELIATMDTKSVDSAFKALLSKQQLQARMKAVAASPATMENICLGDSRGLVSSVPGPIRAIITDPSYGLGFVSGRRKETANELPIVGDESLEGALNLFTEVLKGLGPNLAGDCHLLVFTGWQVESAFTEAIRGLGWQIRGSLVWVKGNHGLGDLRCQFAPQHERIIHATIGNPEVTPRISNVLYGDDLLPNHPTAKPVSLLQKLIEVTTQPGELVVDPFAGVGSVGVAAKKLNRKFWLAEKDEYYHSQILENMKGNNA